MANESVEFSSSMNGSSDLDSKHLCDLTQGFSFILQSILGVLAFSTLLIKRCREPAHCRRPFWIWGADTTKQALGMLEIHFLNLGLAAIVVEKECITYLVSFMLDSTVGLLLIFILLKIVACFVNRFNWAPLKSGEYGSPFKPHYWLAQCGVYLAVMFIEKLIVGPLIIFDFWNEAEKLLPGNEKLRIAIVIFIVPFIVNVLMFWIVDSLLMRKQQASAKKEPSVHYHKSSAKYGKLQATADSSSDSDDYSTHYTSHNLSSTQVVVVQQPQLPKGRTGNARREVETTINFGMSDSDQR